MNFPQKPRICISLCQPTVAALERSIRAAAEVGDLIEVRLDCLDAIELETDAGSLTKLLQQTPRDSILTYRPYGQGGERVLSEATRLAFWSDTIFSASFFDVELDLAEKFNSNGATTSLPLDWSKTICSQHDFNGVPGRLDQIYDRMGATPARVLKVAVQAGDALDCLAMFHLLERAHEDGREMIAIAMGEAGIATRILGPSRGAFLTYASLDGDTATAPGQLSVRELREVYRVEKIDRHTEIFGLIGSPVTHSLSPLMHNAAFAATGTDAVYIPFETRDTKAFIKRMIHPLTRELNWNVRGLSVTAPHKTAVMAELDWIDPAAREIGAVNTIVVQRDELHGYNTDAVGFIKPLLSGFGALRDARCALIGAGGAARAALWSLQQQGARVTVFARDEAKARALVGSSGAEALRLEGRNLEGFDLVVNATPLGTVGEFANETPATASQLRGARFVYDLVYNPAETRFIREAREAGCKTLGGLAMLTAQAAEQFKLWTGALPPDGVMHEAAERGLKDGIP